MHSIRRCERTDLPGADNALALINGGDELTLKFASSRMPLKPSSATRDFFLWSVGWTKTPIFRVRGAEVEPLPWHGMDDQSMAASSARRSPATG